MDSSVYLSKIADFTALLRREGLRIGPLETAHAIKALGVVGMENREWVKQALKTVLATSQDEAALFDQLFDQFFISVAQRANLDRSRVLEAEQKQAVFEESADRLKFQGERMDLPEELIWTYSQLDDEQKRRIDDFLDKTSNGKQVGPKFKPVTERMIAGKLRSVASQSLEMPEQGGLGPDRLAYKSISSITDEELPQALRLIDVLARQVMGLSHRRQSRGRGPVDFRRTLVKAVGTGGVPLRLCRKGGRKPKQRLVLLCDVSGSMYRFSAFALRFVLGMARLSGGSRAFIFSEGAEEVDIKGDAEDFEKRVTQSGLWRRGTDLASGLEGVMGCLPSATLVIFSDGRTMRAKDADAALALAARKARRIIWLNPLPEPLWKGVPALTGFRQYALMLDCSTLRQLAIFAGVALTNCCFR